MTRIPTLFALFTVLSFALVAVTAPWIAPHAINDIVGPGWLAPGDGAILGTDSIGRDVLSRMIHSTRTTLSLAGLATLISVSLGGVLGLWAALRGGWVE